MVNFSTFSLARNLVFLRTMKWILSLMVCAMFGQISAQQVAPFVDFNGYFKTFQNGFFRQLEFQRIVDFKAGDELVGYVDNRKNLRVFDGGEPRDLSNIVGEYQVSDHLLTWNIGTTLNLYDSGNLKTLTYWSNEYEVRDSIVVFQHTQTNSVMVYYNGQSYTLYSSVGIPPMPDFIGENIVAFRDNGNNYKVFWQGNIYELGVWHNPIKFHGGTDILCFNDPINGTFAIFENGQFLDVEGFFMTSYKAGRGFIVYENQNHDLIYYGNGKKEKLTNFGADFWDVKDDVILWRENSVTYGFADGKKTELARYIPEDYVLKNNTIAFRNLMGGVDALMDGKVKTLTNQTDAQYTIYGNSVMIELFNSSFIYYTEGREYRN